MLQDRSWLYFAVLSRSLATGMIGVLLGVYLAELRLSPTVIGLVVMLPPAIWELQHSGLPHPSLYGWLGALFYLWVLDRDLWAENFG